jgi:hypothetical protein
MWNPPSFKADDFLGFTPEQMTDLVRTGVELGKATNLA